MTACPTPHKTAFPDGLAARREAARVQHDLRGTGGDVYPCVCGAWHLTSKQPSLSARIHRALHQSDQ